MKQIIKQLLAVAILLFSTLLTWAYDFEVDGIYYGKKNDGKTAYVTYKDSNYNSYSGSVVIPSTVTYSGTTYSVTSIGDYAFKNCSGLTSVTIPNSVTSIGIGAYYNCSELTSVTIGNSVTSIGNKAFEGCSGLTKVEISDIAAWCNISFSSYNSSNPLYYAKHLYLNETEVTNLVIPDSVTSIGNYAFQYCSGLTSVTIGNSVTTIGSSAFYRCSGLTSVTIPNSVTSIGEGAFFGCSGLTSVTIGNAVTSIGNFAFFNSSGLTSVVFNAENCTTMGDPAHPVFSYCANLKSLRIGENVKTIPYSAFHSCSGLTTVTIPNSVTSIGAYAFRDCSGLTSVTIPESVTSIGESAFADCRNLGKVRFNATIRNVPTNNVFGSNKDLSFIVGEEVVSIPNNIVYNGGSGGVSKVIALADTPPTATSETFDSSVTSTATLHVKKNTVSKYFLADGWSDFTNIQAISNPVTQISLDNTSLILSLGEAGKLNATVEPADATLTDVIWTASNSCVSVDQDGNIKGLSEGQCIVTAEAIDGSGIKAECIVNVGNIYAESISLNKEVATLDINGLTKLSYTILPENATIKDAECSSSDESVAVCKVNSDNTITVLGLSAGVATITVRTTDGTNRSASCVFYVGDSGAETIDSDSVKVTTEGGAIRISGAAGAVAEVYSLSGALLYRGTDATISLPRGVYIVKVAGTTNKVML